jgi:hypothetical protein
MLGYAFAVVARVRAAEEAADPPLGMLFRFISNGPWRLPFVSAAFSLAVEERFPVGTPTAEIIDYVAIDPITAERVLRTLSLRGLQVRPDRDSNAGPTA